MITTIVVSRTSLGVGHVTFLASVLTSTKKVLIFAHLSLTFSIPCWNLFVITSFPAPSIQPLKLLAGQEGFEPPSSGFGDRRSSRWSYWPIPVRASARRQLTSLLYEGCGVCTRDSTSFAPICPGCFSYFSSYYNCDVCIRRIVIE
jgi:hypothetical protein